MNDLRTKMKLHYFDLGVLIKDTEVHATNTHYHLKNAKNKLFMRKTHAAKMTPRADMVIWKYQTKKLVADLKDSMAKLIPIVQAIHKLQEDCVRTVDSLEALIKVIDVNLRQQIEKKVGDIAAKEAEYKKIGGCSFWQNLFSLGKCSRMKDEMRRENKMLQEKFKHELAAYKSILSRLHYFNDLIRMGKQL